MRVWAPAGRGGQPCYRRAVLRPCAAKENHDRQSVVGRAGRRAGPAAPAMVPARRRVRPGHPAAGSAQRRPPGSWPARDRPAGPARLARLGPARVRTAWTWPTGLPAARIRPIGLRAVRLRRLGLRASQRSAPSGYGPAGSRPVAALWRGSTQARRDPAPAAGRGRDPRRRLRLHPPQSQGHPGPRRRGHDDLSGHLRRDHPHAAQPGQPQPAHPGPAADACPGHPPGGPRSSRWPCPRSG